MKAQLCHIGMLRTPLLRMHKGYCYPRLRMPLHQACRCQNYQEQLQNTFRAYYLKTPETALAHDAHKELTYVDESLLFIKYIITADNTDAQFRGLRYNRLQILNSVNGTQQMLRKIKQVKPMWLRQIFELTGKI